MGSEQSSPYQSGGYFDNLPPEMNHHIQSYLDIPSAVRMGRTHRLAQSFVPNQQNWVNTDVYDMVTYALTHPTDLQFIEILFKNASRNLYLSLPDATADLKRKYRKYIMDNWQEIFPIWFDAKVDPLDVHKHAGINMWVNYRNYYDKRIKAMGLDAIENPETKEAFFNELLLERGVYNLDHNGLQLKQEYEAYVLLHKDDLFPLLYDMIIDPVAMIRVGQQARHAYESYFRERIAEDFENMSY